MFLKILDSVNPKSMWDCEYLESYEGFIKRISGWYEEADYYDGIGRWLFSIWMEVFCDEQEIWFALIKAFQGTNLNCNDANGCVKEVI